MIFKIAKFILRNFPDKWRSWLMIICMMESALVRPGNTVQAVLSVMADGSHDFALNDVEWSYVKKDRARAMLHNRYSLVEVANAFGVTVTELKMQLLEEERVEKLHAMATAAMREQHNNLNHCNAEGCDGVTCEEAEHQKGDF